MKKLLSATAIIITFLATSNAFALVAGPDFFGIDFRFNNPGARANAMGGAFIGLADDATAAYTNPAGLTILTSPELSLEYKVTEHTTRINDYRGQTDTTNSDSNLSFLSYAYPTEKATITLFRHRLLNSKTNYTFTDSGMTTQYNDVSQKLEATTFGIGMGLKVSDSLSLGLTVGFAQFDLNSMEKSIEGGSVAPQGLDSYNKALGTDSDEHYTISLLWNVIDELNLGLVYRGGPEFAVRKIAYQYDSTLDGGSGGYATKYDADYVIKVPDVYGVGLSYRFPFDLTAALDVSYVEYSDLTEDMTLEENGTVVATEYLKIDNAIEIRFGLEYIIDLNDNPLALRVGYYYRPDHKPYYEGPAGGMGGSVEKYLVKGDDDHIFSAGVGFLATDNVQIDLAATYGDLVKEGYLSLVYRFQ